MMRSNKSLLTWETHAITKNWPATGKFIQILILAVTREVKITISREFHHRQVGWGPSKGVFRMVKTTWTTTRLATCTVEIKPTKIRFKACWTLEIRVAPNKTHNIGSKWGISKNKLAWIQSKEVGEHHTPSSSRQLRSRPWSTGACRVANTTWTCNSKCNTTWMVFWTWTKWLDLILTNLAHLREDQV